jgi:hypothetical protein
MTDPTPEERWRQAMLAEDGMPISAGARWSHVRASIESGRSIHVNLSAVPEAKRQAVIAEIRELVKRASELA